MATLVGSLYTSLTLESASFVSNMKRAADVAETNGKRIQGAMNVAKGAITGFVGALSIDAFVGLISKSLDYAGSLGETAQQLGVSTRALQVYSYAATQVGIDQAQLETGLGKFTKTLGDAAGGSKTAADALAKVGVTARDLAQLSPDAALLKVSDGLSKIVDPAQRASSEVAIFGRAGQKLDTLLSGGTQSIADMAREAENLGVILSDKQIADADKTADKIAALQRALGAKISGTVADNAESIGKLASSLADLAAEAVSFGAWLTSHPVVAKMLVGAGGGAAVGSIVPGAGTAVGGAIGAGVGGIKGLWDKAGEMSAQYQFGYVAPKAGTAPAVKAGGGKIVPARTVVTGGGGSKTSKATKSAGQTPAQMLADMDKLPLSFADSAREVDALMGKIDGTGKSMDEILRSSFDLNIEMQRLPNFVDQSAVAAQDFAKSISSGLGQAIIYGQSLGDALVSSIKAAAAELVSSGLLKLLTGGKDGGGGVLGTVFSAIGAAFGGARAGGGPVAGGKSYLVGERGPEIYTPGTSGNIIPNGALGGMGQGGANVHVQVEASPYFDARVASVAAPIVQGAVGAVGKAIAGSQRQRLAMGRG